MPQINKKFRTVGSYRDINYKTHEEPQEGSQLLPDKIETAAEFANATRVEPLTEEILSMRIQQIRERQHRDPQRSDQDASQKRNEVLKKVAALCGNL